jgi:fused signal recognition particle receptor
VAFAIERNIDVPVLFVGLGEKLEDLRDFDPNAFVAALFAVDTLDGREHRASALD